MKRACGCMEVAMASKGSETRKLYHLLVRSSDAPVGQIQERLLHKLKLWTCKR